MDVPNPNADLFAESPRRGSDGAEMVQFPPGRHVNALTRGLWVTGALLLIAAISALYLWHERRQRFEIPLEWARLAPYPKTARNLSASTSGTVFTRTFIVSFTAPAADIQGWLDASPGTCGLVPEKPSRVYAITSLKLAAVPNLPRSQWMTSEVLWSSKWHGAEASSAQRFVYKRRLQSSEFESVFDINPRSHPS